MERLLRHGLETGMTERPFLCEMAANGIQFVGWHGGIEPLAVSVGALARRSAQGEEHRMEREKRVGCRAEMDMHARPAIGLRRLDHGRANRVELDVSDYREQIGIAVHETGLEPPLPEGPRTAMPGIECLNMRLPRRPHGLRYGASSPGGQQQVHMVVHQHVGMNRHILGTTGIPEEAAVVMPILIVKEDGAATDAALGDMERNPGEFQSRLTRHVQASDGFAQPALGRFAPMSVQPACQRRKSRV